MKIVIALDSFKGTLSAPKACDIVRRALMDCRPSVDVAVKPMADGGEGTARALMAARGGAWVEEQVRGPAPGQRVDAGYAWFEDEREAVVEMASASGLMLLAPEELNPMFTTTYGTGELLRSAFERGARRVWLAVGGSATVDGGVGAAAALGWRFLGANHEPVDPVGGRLGDIAGIDGSSVRPMGEVRVLCDVDNPLCGKSGAAYVYGPQKGATPEMVIKLDAGLAHLAKLVAAQVGVSMAEVPGGGAAGGLAAGAMAFMGAELTPGIDAVIEASRLANELQDADWVVTGEGRFDSQSLRGKVVSGVVREARSSCTRVAVMAGSVEVKAAEYRALGIERAFATRKEGMPLDEALTQAESLLYATAQEFAKACL